MKTAAKSKRANQSDAVSIITCTNRPEHFKRLMANYKRQRYKSKELIVVLNKDSMNLKNYLRKYKQRKDILLYQLPEKKSLGYCLNYAIIKANHAYISRFDDDDYYSPFYLNTMMHALRKSKTDIVGKRACLIYLESSSRLLLRHPKEQNRYVEQIAGATLLCSKKIFNKVRFRPVSLGETVGFLRRCKRKGYNVYSTDCFHYVTRRRAQKDSHTWKISDRKLISQSKQITACGSRYRRYATNKKPGINLRGAKTCAGSLSQLRRRRIGFKSHF
ncbi:glycosyltransferase family A protein [Paenibacillus sp. FSL H8-0537]|uniref:glycosyltransferase n=1 Tax=Paenibacillus sp. FSL H8-0537 TaxID=2921399 RepID=UPI003100AD23